jgi:sporulation protein YlmC with PRC-barrel domain
MMILRKPLLVTFSTLAFAGAGAHASADQGVNARSTPSFSEIDKDRNGMVSRAEFAVLNQASDAGSQSGMHAGQLGVTELRGKQVTDKQGQQLGEISEIVLNLGNGKAHAAVLEFGGVLGMGEKQYAFPISQLSSGKGDDLMLQVDKQKLKNAEGFAKNQWPAMGDNYWGRVGGQAKASAGATKSHGAKMQLVRSEELIGKPVRDKSGQELGEIKDVIISLKGGDIRSIALSLEDGGQARIQPKQLRAGIDGNYVASTTREQLKAQTPLSRK